MELAQLKYFQVMANIRHFTRAARMLDVTQPALSRSMSKLEKDLDVRLFKRSDGEIELTQEGARLLRRVDRILRDLSSRSFTRLAVIYFHISCATFKPFTPTSRYI